MNGTWREGSLAGNAGGEVEKVLKMGISLHRRPDGELGREFIYQGF